VSRLNATIMLAEVRLIIASKEARLVLKRGETLVEDELCKFERPISKTEAKDLAEAAFHDCFDLLQHAVHGDGDS
jgi:CYTH domain-containing protein